MTTVIIFTVLGGLLLTSVIISSIAHSRQQALSLKKSKLTQITRSITNLQEALDTLLKIDTKYDLIQIIHKQILALIEKKIELEPHDDTIKNQLNQQKIVNNQYQQNQRENDICKAMPSDESINLASFQLLQITKLLHKFRSKNKLTQARYSELSNHIQRLKLDIEVESHTAQANTYLENKDTVMTQSHLKQARESLKKFPIEFPEKAQSIRRLTEQINNLQKTSSINLTNNNVNAINKQDDTNAQPKTAASTFNRTKI